MSLQAWASELGTPKVTEAFAKDTKEERRWGGTGYHGRIVTSPLLIERSLWN